MTEVYTLPGEVGSSPEEVKNYLKSITNRQMTNTPVPKLTIPIQTESETKLLLTSANSRSLRSRKK